MLVNFKSTLMARGLKQVDLALSLKITPSLLSEIINGRRQANPSLRARIAETLSADESWLFSAVTRIPARAAPSEPAPLAASVAGG
jgi:transcriptional regulator with XRE-family HTH domain